MQKFDVVIIGAGPAGLTAAYELLQAGRGNIAILEATHEIGGISKTVNHRGNRIDIGGHRFFSKSDWVMNWWLDMLPLAEGESKDAFRIAYQGKTREVAPQSAGGQGDNVMLVRNRLSRIYYGGKFFDYPLKASVGTALKLGPIRCVGFFAGYMWARLFPRRPERTLEDFMINRFGTGLYKAFFKDYTEKVWGKPCSEISAEWGAQRIKSLSIAKALKHALAAPFRKLSRSSGGTTETSLIERFLYPKLGPGLMWERTAEKVQEMGARLFMETAVVGMARDGARVTKVTARRKDGSTFEIGCDHVISTMPVRELVLGMEPAPPANVVEVARGLEYRDFITVGLLYRKMEKTAGSTAAASRIVPDNWIYVQERDVKVGRLQFFNNWSPFMVADPDTVWVGMEYFCLEGDSLWNMSDAELARLGAREMAKMNLAGEADVLDSVVIRQPKAYPGYYGTYARFDEIRQYLDAVPNLFLVGRNGMHRYNNQDHSMLSAKCAVDAILAGTTDKDAIWAVNIDDDYHEEISEEKSAADAAVPARQAEPLARAA